MKPFIRRTKIAFALYLLSSAAFADAPNLVTWNINGGEQDKDILAGNAADMSVDIGAFDIVVLQEVISSEQVAEIADTLGFAHWAISDFSPPVEVTGKWFRSLEVAVLSRNPFTRVAEWDTTGQLPNGDPYDPRVSDPMVPTESLLIDVDIAGDARPSRGFLRVDFEDGLSVYAVHWKSSGGDSGDDDLANAAKRENNARGIVANASTILVNGGSVAIAGDFNIQPIGKHVRVGSDVGVDCTPSLGQCVSGGLDGYDDSMAILAELANGYRLLSADLPPTYLRGDFGPGAIDHIAVAGPLASEFAVAGTVTVGGDSYFGSDHSPVISKSHENAGQALRTLSVDADALETSDETLMRLIEEVRERLDIIERMASETR